MAETWYLAWPDHIEAVPVPGERLSADELLRRIEARGPYPTMELAEEARYQDHLEGYWQHGIAVCADHCLGCGKFAKVLAFDNQAGGWDWRVAECKHCGILDSRILRPRNEV